MPRTIKILPFLALLASTPAVHAADSAAPAPLALPAKCPLGLWVWHREEVVDPAARDGLLQFCRAQGVDLLLVQLRYTGSGASLRLANPEAFAAFLTEATKAGVAVEALDGEKSMAFAENRAETLQKLRALLAFQKNQPEGARFVGIHYDIEPYLSQRWKTGEQPAVMREFLDTAVAIRAAAREAGPGFTVSYDIPAWYHGERMKIEFEGATKNFHEHIQDIADYIGVMSYRTKATGSNSVVAISAEEIAYGEKIGKKVMPALETVPLPDEPGLSFHGFPPSDYVAAIDAVASDLRPSPAFGGILLHQYRSVRKLLESAPAAESAAR